MGQNVVVSAVGMFTIASAVNGSYLNFVKPSMRWWLMGAGLALVLCAAYGLFIERGSDSAGAEPHVEPGDAGHAHEASRVGWLLTVPFVLIGVVTPAPLGAFAAQRAAAQAPANTDLVQLGALPPGDPVGLSLSEYTGRALFDPDRSLAGRRIHLIGFVALKDPQQPDAGWYLTRMAVSCCAADAYPVRVEILGAPSYPVDTWLSVVGTWIEAPSAGDDSVPVPVLRAELVERTTRPAQAYDG